MISKKKQKRVGYTASVRHIKLQLCNLVLVSAINVAFMSKTEQNVKRVEKQRRDKNETRILSLLTRPKYFGT